MAKKIKLKKEYFFEVKIIWSQSIEANSKKEAIEILKDSFADEPIRIEPTDKEIKLVKVADTDVCAECENIIKFCECK